VRIVQGQGATTVARIGLFAPHISILAGAADSARSHYEAFRSHHNRSAKLGLGALGAAVLASVLYYGFEDDGPRWAGVGVLAVGFGLSLGASSHGAKGTDHLHQALWFYNRPLAGAR
jgi:hypothetical protein